MSLDLYPQAVDGVNSPENFRCEVLETAALALILQRRRIDLVSPHTPIQKILREDELNTADFPAFRVTLSHL